MTIVYFDCSSGISALMAFAALVDASADPEALRLSLATMSLGLGDLDIDKVDCGELRARRMTVRPHTDEPRRTLADVEAVLGDADLSRPQGRLA